MELMNDSLKHVAKAAELVKNFLECEQADNSREMLICALGFLEKAIGKLSNTDT